MEDIAIFKNKDKQEGSQQPDYRMVASWKVGEEWKNVTVAALWKGDKKNGPILTGKMSKEYKTEEGKVYPAFEIKRAELKTEEPQATQEDSPFDNDHF